MSEARYRQADYKDRRKAAGLVLIAAWVPASRVRDVHDLAQVLREQTGALLPLDPAARTADQQLSLDLPPP